MRLSLPRGALIAALCFFSLGARAQIPPYVPQLVAPSTLQIPATGVDFNNLITEIQQAFGTAIAAGSPGQCAKYANMFQLAPFPCGGGTNSFNGLISGTNTQAAMIVSSGASLTFAGSGTINANQLNSATFDAPTAIGDVTPNTGAFTTLSATGAANFIGAFKIGGAAQTFPASGLLVGTTDSQTLTNKTFSCASNTCTINFTNLTGAATFAQLPAVTGPVILGRVTNSSGASSAAYTPSNGTDTVVVLAHGSFTSGHCVQFNDTAGTVVDAGSTCAAAYSWVPGYGLTSAVGTQNTGSQTIAAGGTASLQLFPVSYTSNHTLAQVDAGQLDLANGGASAITFTLQNPGTAQGNAINLADQSGFGFVITTAGGTANIAGNFTEGAATSHTLPANSTVSCVDTGATINTYACVVVYGDYLRSGGGNAVATPVTALTDGSVVPVTWPSPAPTALTAVYTLLLSGNAHTIANPTGTAVGDQLKFLVQQPPSGGPYTISWDTGYGWENSSVPILNPIPNSITQVTCSVVTTAPTLLCYGQVNSGFAERTIDSAPTPPACTLGAQTATITIASPAVVTVTTSPAAGCQIIFSTTGALPTGITAGNTYYVISAGHTGTTFEFSATSGGSAVNTSGSQSGTHTETPVGYTMQGLANGISVITPTTSGQVSAEICGTIIQPAGSATVNFGVSYQLSYGPGIGPANGAVLQGTQIGLPHLFTLSVAPTATADVNVPFCIHAHINGQLTPGAPYWIDLAAANNIPTAASDIGFKNLWIDAEEIR